MKIEYVNKSQLIADEGSPNEMDKDELSKLKRSIETFGNIQPVIARRSDNRIIGGHHRVKASNGHDIPVIFLDKKPDGTEYSDQDIKLLNLALNEIHGSNNNAKLTARLFDLSEMGADLTLTGLNDIDLRPFATGKDFLTDPDEVPGVDEKDVYVKEGDVWELGGHRLSCNDFESLDVIGTDIITDPPYGMSAVENSGVLKKKGYKPVHGDKSNETAKKLCSRINGCDKVVLWGANYYADALPPSSCWLVWDKNNGLSDQMDCELAWTNLKGVTRKYECTSERLSRVHPTQKPVELISWVMERFNFDIEITDPFGGSGSTLIACEQTNRKCYMMEIDPYYCQVIIERWQNATGKTAKKING